MPDEKSVIEALANAAEPAVSIAPAPRQTLIEYQPQRLDGETPITGTPATVRDYWSWAYSDVMENVQRGAFAEFLVALTLGKTEEIRCGWLGYDLVYRERKIEVKASAYLQSWPIWKYSNIVFGFQRRRQWDPVARTTSEPVRVSAIYVFAHYTEKQAQDADVLDVSKWEFYPAATQELVERFERLPGAEVKSLTLTQLKQLTSAVPYEKLRSAIDQLIGKGL